jgi:hypothetical protein
MGGIRRASHTIEGREKQDLRTWIDRVVQAQQKERRTEAAKSA